MPMRPSSSPSYPLELSLFREQKPWGGWPDQIGEIRSLSGPPNECLILNGSLTGRRLTDVVAAYSQMLLGKDMELDAREPFPLLLRFLCTQAELPAVVHPNDTYTMLHQIPMVGQERVFYIMAAKRGAKLFCGFKEMVQEDNLTQAIDTGTTRELLHPLSVRPGQVYTIPSGRPYALDAGLTLFDIGRHTDAGFSIDTMTPGHELFPQAQAEDLIELIEQGPVSVAPIPGASIPWGQSRIDYLCYTPRFSLRRFAVHGSLDLSLPGDRFRVYTGLRGYGWLRWGFSKTYCRIQPFQSILVPALPKEIALSSSKGMELLETSSPNLAKGALTQATGQGLAPSAVVALGGLDYGDILKEYLEE